jgi:hypothetical protein
LERRGQIRVVVSVRDTRIGWQKPSFIGRGQKVRWGSPQECALTINMFMMDIFWCSIERHQIQTLRRESYVMWVPVFSGLPNAVALVLVARQAAGETGL